MVVMSATLSARAQGQGTVLHSLMVMSRLDMV